MNWRIAQNRYDVTRIKCFRNNGCLADKFSDVGSLSGKIMVEEILGLNDPQRGILVSLEHWQFPKAHDPSDHLLLAGFQNARIFRLNHECPDLFLTDLVLRIAPVPEKP